MATRKRSKMQIEDTPAIRNRAKAAAYEREMTLNEFVLLALTKMGDDELTKLIKTYLKERPERGRPYKN